MHVLISLLVVTLATVVAVHSASIGTGLICFVYIRNFACRVPCFVYTKPIIIGLVFAA